MNEKDQSDYAKEQQIAAEIKSFTAKWNEGRIWNGYEATTLACFFAEDLARHLVALHGKDLWPR